MLSDVALGELFLVGAVPAAVVLGMVGAILAKRHRRVAITFAVLAVVTMLTMISLGRQKIKPLSDLRIAQKALFADMEIGQTREIVRENLGEPDLICPKEGYHAHKVRGTSELESQLYAATAERWIYFARTLKETTHLEERDGCKPLFGEGEVAFNAENEVLWYIPVTDDAFLTF